MSFRFIIKNLIMETIVYYKSEKMDDKYSSAIIRSILNLSLKKGDSFEFFPFNYFDDEKTIYKENIQPYHTNLIIINIKYTMISTWNHSIKNKIEIFLDDLVNE